MLKRHRIASCLAGAALLAMSLVANRTTAVAGSCSDCPIVDMFARTDGWIQIGTGLANANGPACSVAANDTYMAVDSNSAKGRAILAIAQTALLSGRSVTVTGLDTCDGDGGGAGTAPGNVEVMSTFWLKQ